MPIRIQAFVIASGMVLDSNQTVRVALITSRNITTMIITTILEDKNNRKLIMVMTIMETQ